MYNRYTVSLYGLKEIYILWCRVGSVAAYSIHNICIDRWVYDTSYAKIYSISSVWGTFGGMNSA